MAGVSKDSNEDWRSEISSRVALMVECEEERIRIVGSQKGELVIMFLPGMRGDYTPAQLAELLGKRCASRV